MSNMMDAMPSGVDPRAMTNAEFDIFMQNALENFRKRVKESPDYQFARDGEKMGLGDWFEQFGTSTGVM